MTVSSASPLPSEATPRTALPPRPCLRLFSEALWVDGGEGLRTRLREQETAVAELSFEYAGARVAPDDPRDHVFLSAQGGTRPVRRDRAAEARASYLLESFGAVDLECLEEVERPYGSAATHLIHADGDVHALCTFGAYALPQLRRLGWRIEVDASYPVQIVDAETPWYARLCADEDDDDWFSLQLGTEIDGRRVNLMPALIDLLEGNDRLTLKLLEGRSRRFVALALGENRYLPVPAERMRTLLQVLLELYRGESHLPVIRFPSLAAAGLSRLATVFSDGASPLRWSGSEEDRARALGAGARDDAATCLEPDGLRATLRPYQKEGLTWLQMLRARGAGGVLADDMGLGKTLQTIAHLVLEKEAGRMDRPTLVVAPTSLVGNWMREIATFAPGLRAVALTGSGRHRLLSRLAAVDVAVVSYALCHRDVEALATHEYHYLILDEAQVIKNPRSQIHRSVRKLSARHRLCLSGTPMENHLDELWALLDFLNPGLLGDESTFRSHFRVPIERGGDEARLEALRQRVGPFLLRRTKDGVVKDLPPKTEIVRPVELSGTQRDLYESLRLAGHARVRAMVLKKGFSASTVTILAALMKLRQVCCDPRLVSVPSARHVKESAKHDLFFELLHSQLGHGRRVLVFSQFTSMLALLAHGLEARGVRYLTLTGATRHRQRVVDAFEDGDADVFLISLKAGGTGLNLVSADTVIHYDPWWNPAVQSQATDRAYRIGQTKPVFVYNLIVAGSVEEKMLRLQERKRRLANSLLEPRGEGALDLSLAEIEDLFAPLED